MGLFSGLVSSSTPLSPSQCAALTALLTEVWKEGAALPQPQAAAAVPAEGEEAAEGEDAAAAAQGDAEAEQQQEQLAASTGLAAGSCLLSPLHSCWHQLLVAMLQAGYVQDLLALLDKGAAAAAAGGQDTGGKATSQPEQQEQLVLLVSESEAQQLVAAAAGPLGSAGQAVLGLLLPYVSCQQAVVDQLLAGSLVVGSTEPWAGQLLLLLLLRGRLPQLAAAGAEGGDGAGSSSGSRQQQLYHLYSLLLQPVLGAPADSSGLAWAYLTCLFPHAVSQLCQAPEQVSAAAALVAAKMRGCSSLCSFGGAVLLLQRYLEVTMQRPWQAPAAGTASPLWLPCCEAWLGSNGAAVASASHARLLSILRRSDGGV